MTAPDFDEPAFLDRLEAHEPEAWRLTVRRFHPGLVGVATPVLGSRALAEEVVQDSWLAVLGAIARFERRSTLAAWLFTIVVNRARTRLARERRTVALVVEDGPAPTRFTADGHWTEQPRLWDVLDPERIVAGRSLWAHVEAALETLPPAQRAVLILRDLEGQDAETACRMLEVSPGNQRVLLHRARERIRRVIDALG